MDNLSWKAAKSSIHKASLYGPNTLLTQQGEKVSNKYKWTDITSNGLVITLRRSHGGASQNEKGQGTTLRQWKSEGLFALRASDLSFDLLEIFPHLPYTK